MAARTDPERARALVAIAERRFPAEFEGDGIESAWPWAAHALLARLTGALEAVTELRERGLFAEALVLERSLFDHAVTFAWMAIDPQDRVARFARTDSFWRIEMDDDCVKLGGPAVLGPEERAWHEEQVELLPKNMPDLAQRARLADEHWIGRVPVLEPAPELRSFRGLYAMLYRHHSGYEHASGLGLQFVVAEEGGRSRVSLAQADKADDLALVCVIYTITLFIAAEVLGWPGVEEIDAVWD